MEWDILVFLLAAGFIAAFIDSVVGGGGLISLPALLLTGMPPTVALGTNKLASSMSSLTSSLSFFFSGKINIKLVRWLFPLSLVGSAAGSYVVTLLPSEFLRPLVVILLIVMTVYTVFKKKKVDEIKDILLTNKIYTITAIFALILGFYDGFFGPGTGAFLIFGFVLVGFDFVRAAGNAKVLNFGSNIASLITFAFLGQVNYAYGIPMGIAMIFGALAGSQLAIRKGSSYVRPLFIAITVVLIGKQVYDLLK
ncbi:membrane protein [Paenibacillus swuensis]|uniref:Probable membrane transporter protein n=1 Tax=Paenibacillus swuensis TaxID=1178515 RepID=A0A172TEZ8_9BACL|nr:TSUP family transporter [Paenibacillus swuensis]ANE45628.1 membrane protein [Paenibacillus swuensis]